MSPIPRRRVLASTGALAGAALIPTEAAAAARPTPAGRVLPGDVRYPDLVRGFNLRWAGKPDYVLLPTTTEQVVRAVSDAVRSGRRVTVRSGGHCFEDFTTTPDIKVVIDLSQLAAISYDAGRRAIEVEAGATLVEVYDTMFRRWGVTVPGGQCLSVGAGGHVPGAGYGPMSRMYGLISDHLYAVEVVVVDRDGGAHAVVARRDDPDARLRDLWWAHTGGGGGSFGVVTRFWFRTPGATGDDPSGLLPKPPSHTWLSSVIWPWEGLTEAGFTRLVRNYGSWYERHRAAGTPFDGLFSRFNLLHKAGGVVQLASSLASDGGDAEQRMREFVAAIGEGVGVPSMVTEHRRVPWLHSVSWANNAGADPTGRADYKSANMRRGFTAEQLAAMYRHLTRTDYQHQTALVSIASLGGRIGAVAPGHTAVAQRDSIMRAMFFATWHDPAEDDRHVAWVREFYKGVFAATGGVPVPNEVTDGCFINYPDGDLNDPRWNSSGVPWHTLYFKDNYARLQRTKAQWDPRNVFHHSQSIRPPAR
ncbi:hypothetical protein HNR61_004690 [Actinomadura namibiensis]|uniref:FAD-binding PCMH-type domain-containing protein n=1 Tax=Actinomadura namibiensis TaxID=182080 RepID=A0A7W3LRV0_ACTNM|nr:FAD-binding oxidoreductase [Actinomadura namibiensis]MBA8953040.1 hypothetical protein [Actinomadura namibiensis]